MNIKRMSLESLMNLSERDISSLSKSELTGVINRLAYIANKRVQRLSKNEVFSPAYEGFSRRGEGKFTSKGKNEFELKKEFLRTKGFLEMQTSTVHGAQAVRREVREKLKKKYGIKITNKQYNDFFKVYERLKEVDSSISIKTMKYNVFDEISNILDSGATINQAVDDMRTRLSEIYQQSVGEQDSEFSKFFEGR